MDNSMDNALTVLYNTALTRRDEPSEGSYTRYLYDNGLDKILKKIGEEAAETIIAAKNGINDATIGEICDLLYHLTVLMVQIGINPDDITTELRKRAEKTGNLKTAHQSDRNS